MSVGVGKPPQKVRSAEDAVCKYYASTGQRFLLSKPVSASVHDTSRAVSGRTWSEARAPSPPPSDKLGATPPGDAYAPLGAATMHRAPPTAPRLPTSPPPRRSARQAPAHCAPHLHPISQLQRNLAPCRKSTTFHSLKRWGNGLRNAAGSPDTTENNEQPTNAEPF